MCSEMAFLVTQRCLCFGFANRGDATRKFKFSYNCVSPINVQLVGRQSFSSQPRNNFHTLIIIGEAPTGKVPQHARMPSFADSFWTPDYSTGEYLFTFLFLFIIENQIWYSVQINLQSQRLTYFSRY